MAVPIGQLLLSIYGWPSMVIYLYLVVSIIMWRRKTSSYSRQFSSSYYLLFILQAVADFYVFLFIEIIQKPIRFNYFNVSQTEIQSVAVLSYTNVMISSSVINCGHVVIAMNRWTAIFKPSDHAKIWSRTTIFISVFGLWLLFIIYSLVLIFQHEDTIRLTTNRDGEFVVGSSMMDRTFTTINCVRGAVTVVLCSIFYISALIKCRHSLKGKTAIERRLLLCALTSSAGFLPNFVGTAYLAARVPGTNDSLAALAIKLWYYENELMTTISVWLQIAINSHVRRLLMADIKTHHTSTIAFTNQ